MDRLFVPEHCSYDTESDRLGGMQHGKIIAARTEVSGFHTAFLKQG
jgi:hypothetical protein